MTHFKYDYIHAFKDRHGKQRCYFRRPGYKRVALPGRPGSQEFHAAYQQALASAKPTANEGNAAPGSISALIAAYYQSNDWKQLTPLTHHTYRNHLERFRQQYGNLPSNGLERHHVYGIMDRGADTPGATRNLMKRLRTLYAFGLNRGLVKSNPFLGVKLPKEGKGFRPWTDADIEKFEAFWPAGSKERTALALLLYTVQRRSDVVRMGRQHRAGDALRFTQVKGGGTVELVIPLHPELKRVLDGLPLDNMTFLTTAYGRPFTAAGFTKWFGERAEMAGLPANSSPHGLRKAGSRRLAEADCTPHQIAAVTGHQSFREVERYTRSAAQEKLARRAMAKLDEA